jgi:hypothetical protein
LDVTKIRGALAECFPVWLMLVLISVGMAVTFGVSWPAALSYAAYVSLYVILPGIVLYGVASTTRHTAIVFAAKAAVVGQCVEMSVGLVASMTGLQAIYAAVPLPYAAGLIYWRRRIFRTFEISEGDRPVVPLLVSLAAALFLVFAASLFNFDTIIDQHFTWVAAFASAALSKWPIPEPFLMDVPLHYHYLFNVHVGMAARTFDIPLILVASRLAIVFHAFLFVLTLYAFCESRFKIGWLGAVAAVQMLLTFGYSAVMWQDFHLATASIMFRVASTMVAFEVFLVVCDEILDRPPLNDYRPPLTLIVFMMLVASGTRASMLPMLVGGLGLLWLTHLQLKRQRRIYLALLGAATIGIAAGALFFLGFGRAESDGTKLLFVNPLNLAVAERSQGVYSPIVEALLHAGMPRSITSLIYLVASVLGRTTFLLPGVIVALVGRSATVDRSTRAMLGGVALTGIAMLVLIEVVVPQEIWAFYWYADIGLAVMGAAGLHTLWVRRATTSFWIRGGLPLSALLFAIQLWDFSTGFVPKLLATSLPTSSPVFRADPDFTALLRVLDEASSPGDVLVTGGDVGSFDERVLPAAIPGLQLYASRLILQIYGVRVQVDPRVASRMWLIGNDLSGADARRTVRQDVGGNRALYLLWLGGLPPDRSGLTDVGNWSTMSLWRVEG